MLGAELQRAAAEPLSFSYDPRESYICRINRRSARHSRGALARRVYQSAEDELPQQQYPGAVGGHGIVVLPTFDFERLAVVTPAQQTTS
jgi:hypothetical protein